MTRINKETNVCISISERPSNFGATLFNAAFEAQNDNYIYAPRRVSPDKESLRNAIDGIRALGIRGCGISMPFKTWAIDMVEPDSHARLIGSINTIVNEDGRLIGYNTDYFAAVTVLSEFLKNINLKITMLGSGGVAMAICAALHTLDAKQVTIVSRNEDTGRKLAEKWHFAQASKQRKSLEGDVFINATPIGMAPKAETSPLSDQEIRQFDLIVDVVVNPLETKLAKQAQALGKHFIPGSQLSLLQATRQYELYTGRKAPLEIMKKALKEIS